MGLTRTDRATLLWRDSRSRHGPLISDVFNNIASKHNACFASRLLLDGWYRYFASLPFSML